MLAPVLTRDDNGSNFLTRDPRDPLRFVDPLDPRPADPLSSLVLVMTLYLSARVCVCLFYRSGWMDRAGFWPGGFFRPDLHCVIRKFRYLQKNSTNFPLELCPKLRTRKILLRRIDQRNVLATQFEKGGRPERDKLDRRRSTKFCYRAMLCISGTSHGSVSLSVRLCLSQVGVLSKRMNESSWFLV